MHRKAAPENPGAGAPRRRLAPEDREEQILQSHRILSRHRVDASTRDLPREFDITQPLL